MLTPEVVKRGELEIGRFEVTRAQYADCPSKRRPAGHGRERSVPCDLNSTLAGANFPISGVSLEDAKSYAACLSELSGQTWRLPFEDEVKSLYENREGENTLDYWAGYAPNPEDAARLREKAKEFAGRAPLLKEVGSFPGKGNEDEEPIYDLGGNVAEWVLTRDGKGKVLGGSCDCPADPQSGCTPAPDYVGFRLVRGAAKPTSNISEKER